MKREKFCTALKDYFLRVNFTPEILDALTGHYGIGYKDARGTREHVAWKDFCEDLLSANTHVRPGSPEHDHAQEARGKGHIPGLGVLPAATRGWQPGDS